MLLQYNRKNILWSHLTCTTGTQDVDWDSGSFPSSHFTDSIFKDARRPGSTGTNLCKHNAIWPPHDAYMFSKLVGTTQVKVHVQIAPTNNTEVFPLPWCTKCKSIMETCGLLASAESSNWPLVSTSTSKVLSESVSKFFNSQVEKKLLR